MTNSKPSVMILGTYHMGNNNRDLIQTNYDNHLAPQRRAEIDEVLDKLEPYLPTHIAIEKNADMQATINTDYQQFLQDDFELTANEIHLIGFQLARRLGHGQLYCADHNYAPDAVTMGLGGVLEYGSENGQSYITDYLNQATANDETASWAKLPVREHLLKLNDKKFTEPNHNWYISLAAIGNQPEQHFGADWVGMYWYTRNLKIYANLSGLACTEAGARVLMIVGAGHVKLLNEFLDAAHHLELIPVQRYLA